MMGCDEDAPRPVFVLDDVARYRCPLHYLTPPLLHFISAYGHYRSGFLPEPGGSADQSATFLEAVGVFAGEIARLIRVRENA